MKTAKKYEVNKTDLSNGLPLLTIKDIYSQSVTIMLLVKAGSTSDIPLYSGTAHFLEHMFFKGTKSYPSSLELAMEIEMLGGMTNAFTSYEYTGYYLKVPLKNLEKAMHLFSDVIFNPRLSPEELDKERGVIAEEIRMYDDYPPEKIKDEFESRLFKGSALGRSIAGSLTSIKQIDDKVLKQFRLDNYTLDNMLLVVSGAVDTSSLEGIAEETFGQNKNELRKPEALSENITQKIQHKYFHVKRQTGQAHLILGGFGVGRNHKDEYPLRLAMTILADGFGSKLFQELREKQGISYYLGGGVSSYASVGKYTIKAGVAVEKLQTGITSILNCMKEISDGEFSEKDLRRAKTYYTAEILENVETGEDKAGWFGLNTLLGNRLVSPEDKIAEIEGVSKDQLISAWQKMATDDNLMVGVISENSLDFSFVDAFSF